MIHGVLQESFCTRRDVQRTSPQTERAQLQSHHCKASMVWPTGSLARTELQQSLLLSAPSAGNTVMGRERFPGKQALQEGQDKPFFCCSTASTSWLAHVLEHHLLASSPCTGFSETQVAVTQDQGIWAEDNSCHKQ